MLFNTSVIKSIKRIVLVVSIITNWIGYFWNYKPNCIGLRSTMDGIHLPEFIELAFLSVSNKVLGMKSMNSNGWKCFGNKKITDNCRFSIRHLQVNNSTRNRMMKKKKKIRWTTNYINFRKISIIHLFIHSFGSMHQSTLKLFCS